jgi:hypothetical protein
MRTREIATLVESASKLFRRVRRLSDGTGRLAWMSLTIGLANLLGVSIATVVGIVTQPKLGLAFGTVLVPIFTAAGFIVGFTIWNRIAERLRESDSPFDHERLLEDAFNRDVERIQRLPIPQQKKEQMLLVRVREHQRELGQLRALHSLDRRPTTGTEEHQRKTLPTPASVDVLPDPES